MSLPLKKTGEICVTLVGYHGRNNLGDDMFRDVIVRQLNQYESVTTCYVLCAGVGGFAPYRLGGMDVVPIVNPLKTVARFKWLQLLLYGSKSSLVVFAAGSIFTRQAFGFIRFVLATLRYVRRRTFSCVALGVSVGPFPDENRQQQCDRLLHQFDHVLLRDHASVHRLEQSMLFSRYTSGFDLGLLASHSATPDKTSASKWCVALSLTSRAFPNAASNRELAVLMSALKQLLDSNSDMSVLAFSACSDPTDGDGDLTAHFSHEFSDYGERVTSYTHEDSQLECSIATLANCEAVIASRMHVGIVAMMHAIPTLQISYEPKVRAFYDQHELDDSYLLKKEGYTADDVISFVSDVRCGKAAAIATQQKQQLDTCALIVDKTLNEIFRNQLQRVSTFDN